MLPTHTNNRKKLNLTKQNKYILDVRNLKIHFKVDEGILKAVDGVTFRIPVGKTLGLVGESGCGKSVTAYSLLQLLPKKTGISGQSIFQPWTRDETVPEAVDLVSLPFNGKKIRNIRGGAISMIFQEPMTSFSPVHSIGNQIIEAIRLHRTRNYKHAHDIAAEMLSKVGIPDPVRMLNDYPGQLSGGMRQRAMIAMALCCNPSLLIADEPTTALDVTVQAQVLELMKSLQEELGTTMLFITHDLGVIAELADYVAVMYLGRIVEYGTVTDIIKTPRHPYTQALLKAIPRLGKTRGTRLESIEGTVPIPIDFPDMCPFFSRCSKAMKGTCNKQFPPSTEKDEHSVNCFLYCNEERKAQL